MGGLQTLYAGVKNTKLFSYLGSLARAGFPINLLSNPQYEFMKNNVVISTRT
jgi:hypothetical protein